MNAVAIEEDIIVKMKKKWKIWLTDENVEKKKHG